MSSAAPTACPARAATRTASVGARAQAADATANTISPSWNVLRRPSRSASRPAGTRQAAKTIAYAFSTQESEEGVLPGKLCSIAGNAMLTMKRSS